MQSPWWHTEGKYLQGTLTLFVKLVQPASPQGVEKAMKMMAFLTLHRHGRTGKEGSMWLWVIATPKTSVADTFITCRAFDVWLWAGEGRQRELIIIYHVPDGRNARTRMVLLGTHQYHHQSAKKDRKQILGKGRRPDCTNKLVASKGRYFLTANIVIPVLSFCLQKFVNIF